MHNIIFLWRKPRFTDALVVPFLPAADSDATGGGDVILASSSHDATARLTSYNAESKSSRALASLHLHTAPISSISASSTGAHLLTAGWDSIIGVWDTRIPSSDEVAPDSAIDHEGKSRKRRRVVATRVWNRTLNSPCGETTLTNGGYAFFFYFDDASVVLSIWFLHIVALTSCHITASSLL